MLNATSRENRAIGVSSVLASVYKVEIVRFFPAFDSAYVGSMQSADSGELSGALREF